MTEIDELAVDRTLDCHATGCCVLEGPLDLIIDAQLDDGSVTVLDGTTTRTVPADDVVRLGAAVLAAWGSIVDRLDRE